MLGTIGMHAVNALRIAAQMRVESPEMFKPHHYFYTPHELYLATSDQDGRSHPPLHVANRRQGLRHRSRGSTMRRSKLFRKALNGSLKMHGKNGNV